MRPDWRLLTPQQRLEAMEPHRLGGASAKEMSMLFDNCSRNSVIGQLVRAKVPLLGKRSTVQPQKRAPWPKKAPRPRTPVSVPTGKRDTGGHIIRSMTLDREREEIDPVEVIVDASPNLLTLLQVNDHVCRWPIGDPREPGFGFCGAGVHGTSVYCRKHDRRAYNR